mgnify:FL=1|tara:strand:- start:123 stop:326 length:204 start_codon:yes stop_codon:yes gene_type:complete
MNKASEEIKGYRSVIKKDFDILEKKLNNIEMKIDMLSDKLDKHINFIDDTYEGLKNPIKMATRFFKR